MRDANELPDLAAESPARRPTAVSQVLQAIAKQACQPAEFLDVPADGAEPAFRIRVASDESSRRRAYALAHRVYSRCAYVPGEDSGLCVSAHDALPETLTLLAEDGQERAVGTISLVFDTAVGLPCDQVYGHEIQSLRSAGCRLVEFTRLAMEDGLQHARPLLQRLFCISFIHAKYKRGCTDLVIEVHPRHAAFYKRYFLFEEAGPVRPCPRVNGAPAVLLRMPVARYAAAVDGYRDGRDAQGRRLHPFPYTRSEEHHVAAFLAGHHRPMSSRERMTFLPDVHAAQAASAAL